MAAKFKVVGKLPFISKKEVSQTKNFDKLMSRMEAENMPKSAWSGKSVTAIVLAGVLVVSLGVGITVYQLTGDSELVSVSREQLTDNNGQISVSREEVSGNSEQETVVSDQLADNSDQLTVEKEGFEVSDSSLGIDEITSNKLNSEQAKTAENLGDEEISSISSDSSQANEDTNSSSMSAEESLVTTDKPDQISSKETKVLDYEKARPIVGFDSLYSYFASAINYPDSLRPQQIYGKVVVEFVLNKSGKAEQVKVLESLHPALDEEAIRMVTQMPKWKPAKVYGEPISSKMSIPITFQLK